eukprot:CAMPEP_0204578462 /NCGR_PEP_ID=MMETSP0661-20131031/42943_1 /ASSEMBLY_ACC=CAM_ASM_000606 /TAXON_ID=109239 /ORGANISM="Alexandrium margalefi, Strain AMGDE01CS-322" /LENGTH=377 /DNA_ID=CAMNT_0051587395 /DNA_START=61 /DNA_END=1191 /DNA_ORIENTATION=-
MPSCLAGGRPSVLGPRASELGQALEGLAKVLLELALVLGVDLEVLAEALVPQEHHVGDQHHLVPALPDNGLAGLLVPTLDDPVHQRPGLGRGQQRPRTVELAARDLAVQGAGVEADLRRLELLVGLQPAPAAPGAGLLEGWGAALGHGPVAALQRLEVKVALAREEGLPAGRDDGDPTAAIGAAPDRGAEDLHRQHRDLLVLVQAPDDGGARVGHLAAVHPRGDALVPARGVLLGVRRRNRGLLRRVALVLGEVDVLTFARLRPHLLGHGAAVGHLRVVRDRDPLVPDHVRGVLVAEERGVLDPGARVPGALGVAAPVDVAAGDQRHGLLIAEAHAAKDLVADVVHKVLPALEATLGVQLEPWRDALLGARQPPGLD